MNDDDRPALRGIRAVQVSAQAKVNLRLRILAREDNGYHQIETLFLRVDLADIVRVRRTSGARSLDVTGDADLTGMGPPEQNLAWRAADAYLAANGERGGFAIEIEKRIPIGGGLGGGSADAGAVLRSFDATSDTPMSEVGLMALAETLGADVPFLTSSHPYALAWSRGERMAPLPAPPVRPVLLIVPGFAVNTAEAYGWLDSAREEGKRPIDGRSFLDLVACSTWAGIEEIARNDFEAVVERRFPVVAACVEELRSIGCEVAMLSGSGSTVFGIGPAPNSSGWHLAVADIGKTSDRRLVITQTASRVEPVLPIE